MNKKIYFCLDTVNVLTLLSRLLLQPSAAMRKVQAETHRLLESREELKQPEHCALPLKRPRQLSTLNHIFPVHLNTCNIPKHYFLLYSHDCFLALWGFNLPPCRACSLHPTFWPQSPPGGRWCRSRTFSLGPECWSERWMASRLQVNTTAGQQWETLQVELKKKKKREAFCVKASSDYLCVSPTAYCAGALMPWQSVEQTDPGWISITA